MRVAERTNNSSNRSHARHCEAPDCGKHTREGKPFCSDHVELNDYATSVIQQIARRDADDSAVKEKTVPISRYNLGGITAGAIVQYLAENGPRTRARICKDIGIERDVLDGYALALVRARVVRRGRTSRGNETLELVKAP